MVGGDEFSAALRDLPTIVETYKTYDDVNMVKCTDIGQVRSFVLVAGWVQWLPVLARPSNMLLVRP